MFKTIVLKNFQGWSSLKLDLDPRVTTIVGPTDAGKSAVMRALGLVCLNWWDPCFVRNDEGSVTVYLDVDGKRITRRKGNGINIYKIGSKTFTAFGTNVPEEISRLVNCGPENFQRQLDPHFWFSESAGQVSKNLNRIVNLGLIDQSLSYIASEVRKSKSEVEVTKSRLIEFKEQKEKLNWVINLDRDLRRVENCKEILDLSASSRSSVEFLLSSSVELLAREKTLSDAWLDADKLLQTLSTARKYKARYSSLRKLIREAEKTERLASLPVPDLSELLAERASADQVAERRRNLEMLIEELQLVEDELCVVEKEYEEHNSMVISLIVKRKKSLRKCPMCQKRLTEKEREMVAEKLSQSSAQTFTCDTHVPYQGLKKTTGTKFKQGTSNNSETSPTSTKSRLSVQGTSSTSGIHAPNSSILPW